MSSETRVFQPLDRIIIEEPPVTLLYSGKLQGQTAEGAEIATKDFEIHNDGTIRYTDANGHENRIQLSGEVALLFKELLTGSGGYVGAWLI